MEEGLGPAEIPPDPGGDVVEDEPVDTGRKQGPGPLKSTPPSPGDSSGSESEECLPRGKRRRPSDSGSSGAEGVASQTPLKISKIGEGGMTDASAPSSAPASPTKSMTSETAISVAIPQSAAQVDKGEVGLPPPLAKKDKAHAPAAPKEALKGRKATNAPRNGTQGDYRRRPSQQGSRAPAFVDHPVVIHDLGGGTARFDKLGPWHRSQLLANAIGAVSSIRPLPSGKWLIGCSTEDQQTKLARLEALPGGVPIGARIPRPVVEGVVGPIPMGGEELRLVRKDLESGGHRVAGVTRLNNRKNEPSMAVKISLEATELPEEVWLGATPYCVQAYAAPVRRCTKCQTLGHTKQQCRSRQSRCSRCGKNTHTHDNCDSKELSCVNCNGRHSAAFKGCPEVLIRQRANILRSKKYLPFNVAMQRARADLKPREQEPAPPTSNAVDGCWSRDRVNVTAASLRSGSGPPLSYASVTAGRVDRMGQGTGRGPIPRNKKTDPKPASVSAPGAKKDRTAQAVADLFARLADVTAGTPTGRPISPLPEAGTESAPTRSAGCSGTLGTDAVEEVLHSPKAKRRRVRKKKAGKAGLKTASLQYQLLLEQRKTKILEKKLQEATPAPQREDLRTELNELFDTADVEPQLQQGTGGSQSLDVSLWKLMISLLQTRLTGDCAPLLKDLTALINELTGQGLTGLARSGDKDVSSATR